MAYLEEEALRDGDAWLKGLLKRNEMLGALHFYCSSARAGPLRTSCRAECACSKA